MSSREADDFQLPTFLCDSYDALPPRGFAAIAGLICNLRDEVASFRLELQEHRRERTSDIKSLEDLSDAKEDISDTKRQICDMKNNVNTILNVVTSKPNNVGSMANATSTNATNHPNAPPSAGPMAPTLAQIVKRGLNTPFVPVGAPLVNRPKPAKVNVNRGILGTKKPSALNRIAGVVRNLDVFVGRCVPGTTTEDVKEYCTDNGVTVDKCEEIKTNSSSSTSFKVTIAAGMRDKLLDSDFWPEDVVVRKFYAPRKSKLPSRLSSSGSHD